MSCSDCGARVDFAHRPYCPRNNKPLTAQILPSQIALSGKFGPYEINHWPMTHEEARTLRDSLNDALGSVAPAGWVQAKWCKKCKSWAPEQ